MTKIINKCNACKVDTQCFFHKGNESYPNGKKDQGCEAEGCTTVCTQYNTKHDKVRLKNPPLHPNKWAKTQTLTIM